MIFFHLLIVIQVLNRILNCTMLIVYTHSYKNNCRNINNILLLFIFLNFSKNSKLKNSIINKTSIDLS